MCGELCRGRIALGRVGDTSDLPYTRTRAGGGCFAFGSALTQSLVSQFLSTAGPQPHPHCSLLELAGGSSQRSEVLDHQAALTLTPSDHSSPCTPIGAACSGGHPPTEAGREGGPLQFPSSSAPRNPAFVRLPGTDDGTTNKADIRLWSSLAPISQLVRT